jgi:hypothetical protein
MATRMLQRRGGYQEWINANPILGDGEIAFIRDSPMIVIGDGSTPFQNLPPLKLGTPAATPNATVLRNASGQASFGDPTSGQHAVTLGYALSNFVPDTQIVRGNYTGNGAAQRNIFVNIDYVGFVQVRPNYQSSPVWGFSMGLRGVMVNSSGVSVVTEDLITEDGFFVIKNAFNVSSLSYSYIALGGW